MSSINTLHLEITEESDFDISFTYTDDSTGLPRDLTGYTAKLQAREACNGVYSGYDNPNVALTLTDVLDSNGSGIILGTTNGSVTITINHNTSKNLLWNRGIYSLMLINPTGKQTPIISGFITILSNATKM